MPTNFIGDTEVTWFYEPDPELVAQQIFAAADELANTRRPLEIARDILIADMLYKFNHETGAEAKWQPWSEEYAPRAGEGILNKTGKMLRSATYKNAWRVTRSQIFFSLASSPKTRQGYPVGLLHEEGTESATARRLKSRLERHFNAIQAGQPSPGGLTNEEFDTLKAHSGRGKNLPRREWIGPTIKAQEAVVRAFTEWLEGGIRTATGKFIPGVVSGAGGRFTSIKGR